jgi:hypothetical protein
MFDHVTKARDQGVNLLFLSGNSVDGTAYLDPSTDGRPNRVTGRLSQRHFENEQDLMGSSSHGVGYCAFVCKAPDHWVYSNTGMKLNDSIPDLVGWECHGLPLGNQEGLVVLAQNKTYMNQFNAPDPPVHAAVIYELPQGNFVFNAGTCWWSMLLSTPPGFKNPVYNIGRNGHRVMNFSEPDQRVRQMTTNLFQKVLETKVNQ